MPECILRIFSKHPRSSLTVKPIARDISHLTVVASNANASTLLTGFAAGRFLSFWQGALDRIGEPLAGGSQAGDLIWRSGDRRAELRARLLDPEHLAVEVSLRVDDALGEVATVRFVFDAVQLGEIRERTEAFVRAVEEAF
jgi:hypothetical protein